MLDRQGFAQRVSGRRVPQGRLRRAGRRAVAPRLHRRSYGQAGLTGQRRLSSQSGSWSSASASAMARHSCGHTGSCETSALCGTPEMLWSGIIGCHQPLSTSCDVCGLLGVN